MKKYAVISMDVEDWYHNDYFLDSRETDRSYHMLDGLDVMTAILERNQVPGTFFVLAELLEQVGDRIAALDRSGSEIACHGNTHIRPITMEPASFREELKAGKRQIEALTGHEVIGYRAPTYGLDDERLSVIRELGFQYDSSKNALSQNPKYGCLELKGFQKAADNIYTDGDFCEFEISTQEFLGYKLPLGGGYLRMLPWLFNEYQLKEYADSGKFYVLYVHPFELSAKRVPYVSDAGFKDRIRSTLGRGGVSRKVELVIRYMKSRGYEFVTFRQLRRIVLQESGAGEK